MIADALQKVVAGEDLSLSETESAMEAIMEGQATPAQIAGLVTALRLKGETVPEITGAARVMRRKVTAIRSRHPLLMDTAGTGGDRADTFNISTTAAFVIAGAGLPVAKHGNRSVSSSSGSADVLEALGVKLSLSPEAVSRCLDEIGIGFLFAPQLHGAMKYAAPVRKELGFRTIFNVLGPLTNPANAQTQLVGVFDPTLTSTLAEVLGELGSQHALVVHGAGHMDEISLLGSTQVAEVDQAGVRVYTLDPQTYGFKLAHAGDLRGGTPAENAAIMQSVLNGTPGPQRDIVILNAAAALVAGEKAENLTEGIELARRSIDEGGAQERLEAMRSFTQRAAAQAG